MSMYRTKWGKKGKEKKKKGGGEKSIKRYENKVNYRRNILMRRNNKEEGVNRR